MGIASAKMRGTISDPIFFLRGSRWNFSWMHSYEPFPVFSCLFHNFIFASEIYKTPFMLTFVLQNKLHERSLYDYSRFYHDNFEPETGSDSKYQLSKIGEGKSLIWINPGWGSLPIKIIYKHKWGEIIVPFIIASSKEVRNHGFRSMDDGTFTVPEDIDLFFCSIIIYDIERKRTWPLATNYKSCPWLSTMVIISHFRLDIYPDHSDTYWCWSEKVNSTSKWVK